MESQETATDGGEKTVSAENVALHSKEFFEHASKVKIRVKRHW